MPLIDGEGIGSAFNRFKEEVDKKILNNTAST
jgi:hypothetical protein